MSACDTGAKNRWSNDARAAKVELLVMKTDANSDFAKYAEIKENAVFLRSVFDTWFDEIRGREPSEENLDAMDTVMVKIDRIIGLASQEIQRDVDALGETGITNIDVQKSESEAVTH